VIQVFDKLGPVKLSGGLYGRVVLLAREHLADRQWFVTLLLSSQTFVQRMDMAATTQLGSRVQRVGFTKSSASTAYAQRPQSVIGHVSSTDPFAGTFSADEDLERYDDTILKELPRVIGTNLWNSLGDTGFKSWLDLFKQQILS
jgi:hypothetical protein